MRVLVVNAGSSNLKLSLLARDDATLWARELDAPHALVDEEAVAAALAELPAVPDVVGHRIVHGGERFRDAVPIDAPVEAALRELEALAPLHQAKSLAALDAVTRVLPTVPAVACFDTAFHATLSPAAAMYALPRTWRERYGLRRYGFHGLSHAYAARRTAALAGDQARVVSCHLGAGASLCAIAGGRSVDTTMGFTPLEGLVMARRSGSVDPGLLLWLQQHAGLSAEQIGDALELQSGLMGLAGTADMRELLARDDAAAHTALDVYTHRLRAGIGAMTAALGGLDALVFTGGVGTGSPRVRELVCAGLAHLGVEVDAHRNEGIAGDAVVSSPDKRVNVLVVQAREDIEIARQAGALLGVQGLEHL